MEKNCLRIKEFLTKRPRLKSVLLNMRLNMYYAPYELFRYIKKIPGMYMRGKNYQDKKYLKLKNLKGKYDGKRCFIVCTGPSLSAKDLDKLIDELSFGMNSIAKIFSKTSWRPTFYGIIDRVVYNHIIEDDIEYTETAFIPDSFCKIIDESKFSEKVIYPLDNFESHKCRILKKNPRFSDNPYKIVYEFATVTYSLLQIAMYLGFKEIYLLGCDCNYSGAQQHFDDYGVTVRNNPERDMILAYTAAKHYADSHGIKIYNATRGGKLEVFERVDFDSLFLNKDDEDKCSES